MLERVFANMRVVCVLRTKIISSILPLGSFPLLCRTLSNTVELGSRGEAQPSSRIPAPEPEDEDPEEQQKPSRKPSESSVLLFPGQGSQFVGMGRGLLKYPNVAEMFAVAQKMLGYDLLSLCLNGPEEELMKTIHCQPAVFVTSLAAVERLNHENPTAIETCIAAAGFSVGEFAALVFSGAMDFAEALYVVMVRAQAMQEASEKTPSGMLSVIGRPQTKYKYACVQAKEHCQSLGIQDPVCSIANYLFPDGRVVAGHREALDFLQKNARRHHFARARQLPVSGAFHTPLMRSAVEPLCAALRGVTIRRPAIAVHGNVDGQRYTQEERVRHLLARQVVEPVRWEQTLHALYERSRGRDFPHTYEVGPGRQLGVTLQQCNAKAYKSYTHVDAVALEE